MKDYQRILILGSTGSIGENTLNVISRHPDKLSVSGLSANTRINRLAEQAALYKANFVIVPDQHARENFINFWNKFSDNHPLPEIYVGKQALVECATGSSYDTVMIAIVGIAGLPAAMAAAQSSKRILLANKEILVSAGKVFLKSIDENNSELLPIDSEHNAIFQCLQRERKLIQKREKLNSYVNRLLLTASGGPFRKFSIQELELIKPEQACLHPNWNMGKKISIDSSTMMNKGLEVIEAHWLFSMPVNKIHVVIHPQSIIHSMVEYIDGSIIAQLGQPDMRIPIAYSLGFPDRLNSGVNFLDLVDIGRLDFKKIDLERFPCLSLSIDALNTGQEACTVLNAANEVAVDRFLKGKIRYTSIPHIIESSLNWFSRQFAIKISNLEDVMDLDKNTREFANNFNVI
ncbi:MAG: 1-deoxy-D-xylulose-5-phosphate reductoisomerase [Bordetella sp.]|nr:MAG: 1-deoxy-D-xylulose-5-phosphate reductoisomerase [Bordetella sp.]